MTYQRYQTTQPHKTSARLAVATIVVLSLGLAGSIVKAFAETSTNTTPPAILINEIKSSGSDTTAIEYVTLYNQSDKDISLDGWVIEFVNTKLPSASCSTTDWKAASTATSGVTTAVNKLPPGTILAAGKVSEPLTLSINNSGSVHVVDNTKTVVDLVGWGSSSAPAACKNGTQASVLAGSQSIVRYMNCLSTGPINTNSNADDFMLNKAPDPTKTNLTQAPQCTPPEPELPDEPVTSTTCQSLTISELLPNPASTDTGHEYIELHNTATVDNDISGCSLQTSANSKVFDLAGIVLAADQYYILGDSQSGLTLANSNGTVWLMDDFEQLQTIIYPVAMEDDTTWALADGQWGMSYTPTPSAANIMTVAKPCPDGQIRNSETNRCVTISSTSSDSPAAELTPCDPGQERNPETNRCRAISATATAAGLTTCKAGQERNPETNRCRNIASAMTTEAKACPAGQERNPETNRCRKVTAIANSKDGSDGLGGVKDVATEQIQKSKPYWLIAGIVLAGAIGYAIYEWRQEMRLAITSWLSRFKQAAPHGQVQPSKTV